LPEFHVVAACAPSYDIDRNETIDIRKLARQPLLLLSKTYATRAIFDAACRLSGVQPNVHVESVGAHALLGLAEAGQGIAIIPSVLRTEGRPLRRICVTQRRQPLRIFLAVLWDRRRMLSAQAESCGELLADHIRRTFDDTADGRRRAVGPERASAANISSGATVRAALARVR
jgi:DNA-binding transcriptional LysR family regulator